MLFRSAAGSTLLTVHTAAARATGAGNADSSNPTPHWLCTALLPTFDSPSPLASPEYSTVVKSKGRRIRRDYASLSLCFSYEIAGMVCRKDRREWSARAFSRIWIYHSQIALHIIRGSECSRRSTEGGSLDSVLDSAACTLHSHDEQHL